MPELAQVHLTFDHQEGCTVELKAAFRCADLTIQDGRIVEIAGGDCQATAQLKYRDTKLHKALKSRQVALTRPCVLAAPGLAIG